MAGNTQHKSRPWIDWRKLDPLRESHQLNNVAVGTNPEFLKTFMGVWPAVLVSLCTLTHLWFVADDLFHLLSIESFLCISEPHISPRSSFNDVSMQCLPSAKGLVGWHMAGECKCKQYGPTPYLLLYLIKYFKCILTDGTLSIHANNRIPQKNITGKSGSPDIRIDLLSTFQCCLLVHAVRMPTILHHALIVQMRSVTTNAITEISLMQVGLFPQFWSYTGIWNVHISDIVWYCTFSLHVLMKDLKKIPDWPCIKHPCQ